MQYNFLKNKTYNIDEIEKNQKYLFIFDGAYAYSPKRFNAYLKASRENFEIVGKVKDIIDTEKRRVSYTPLLDMVFTSKYAKGYVLFYFAQRSIKVAKELSRIIIKNHKNYEINIAGYSWGGDATTRFTKYLNNKDISVKSVYTLDPIRRGAMFLGFTKSIEGNIDYFKKYENVESHYNIYQKTDRFALPLIHLRGNKVQGADLNLNLSEINQRASHVNLHIFEEVMSLLNN